MTSVDDQVAEVVSQVSVTEGLVGLVFCGSGARGELRPQSDLDFVAFIRDGAPWPKPFRDGGREVTFNRAGRQVEVAFTTPDTFRRRMRDLAEQGEPFRAEVLTEGRVLLQDDVVIPSLIDAATHLLAGGPAPLAERDRRWECFALWNRLKDVSDSRNDPLTARYLAADLFKHLVQFFFRLDRRWQPRPRQLLVALAAADASLSRLAEQYLRSCAAPEEYDALSRMMDHLRQRFELVFDATYVTAPRPAADS